jgi:hypothetical protein
METYYKPEDLPKFPDTGQQAPELAQKFFDYYNAVFAEGELTERKNQRPIRRLDKIKRLEDQAGEQCKKRQP